MSLASSPDVETLTMSKRWYAVNTLSGSEEKAVASLRQRMEMHGLDDRCGRILVPSETVVDPKTKRKTKGKASSVQFIHFPFNADQIAAFRDPGNEIVVGFDHENYAHMAVMPEPVRAALAEDFD